LISKVERTIAYRYLKPKKKEGFLKIISIFSFTGIALGVAILIIVMSVMSGFRTELINKIGVSIYNFNTLDKILDEFKVDMIQVPFNILDRRLATKNYLNKIKKKKIQIHVRSIFLQGILLANIKKIPKKFLKWKNLFKSWHAWLEKNKLSKLQACLNFILSFKQIDVIIFGACSKMQIKQIINTVNQSTKLYPKNIISNNLKLIDPRQW